LVQPTGRRQGALRENGAVGGDVAQAQLLAQAQEPHFVLTDDIAATRDRVADGAGPARTRPGAGQFYRMS
jgi:hypothetical protein